LIRGFSVLLQASLTGPGHDLATPAARLRDIASRLARADYQERKHGRYLSLLENPNDVAAYITELRGRR